MKRASLENISPTDVPEGQNNAYEYTPAAQPRLFTDRLLDLDLGLPFLGVPFFGELAANNLSDVVVSKSQDDNEVVKVKETVQSVVEESRESTFGYSDDLGRDNALAPLHPSTLGELNRVQDADVFVEDQDGKTKSQTSGHNEEDKLRKLQRDESSDTKQRNDLPMRVVASRPMSIVSNLYSASEKSLESPHLDISSSAMEHSQEGNHIDIIDPANNPIPANDQPEPVIKDKQDAILDDEDGEINQSEAPKDTIISDLQATNSDLSSRPATNRASEDVNSIHQLKASLSQTVQGLDGVSELNAVLPPLSALVSTIDGTDCEVVKPAGDGSQQPIARDAETTLPSLAGASSNSEVLIPETERPDLHRKGRGDLPSSSPSLSPRASPMRLSPRIEKPVLYSATQDAPTPPSPAQKTPSPGEPPTSTLKVTAMDRRTQKDQDVISYISSLGIRIGNNVYLDRDNSTSSSVETSNETTETQTTNTTSSSPSLTKATPITTSPSTSSPMTTISATSPGRVIKEQKKSSGWQLPIRNGNTRSNTPLGSSKEVVENSLGVIQEIYLPNASPRSQSARRLPHMPSLTRLLNNNDKVVAGKAVADAASNGKAGRLAELLGDNPKLINARISTGDSDPPKTAFMRAAVGGHVKCMEALKAHGADIFAVDRRDRTALHLAIAANQVESVKWLLSSCADARSAVKRNGIHDPKEATDLEGSTPLHVAASKGRRVLVEILRAEGANLEALDKQGRTPLHSAVMNGHLNVCVCLVAELASINAPDADQMTPLHWAAKNCHLRIVDFLLAKGADRKIFDCNGYLPLHYAVDSGEVEAINTLYTEKKDLQTRTRSGETPLHMACLKNRFSVVRALIELGVDVNHWTDSPSTRSSSRSLFPKSRRGNLPSTPLHYACLAGHYDSAAILLKNGAWANAPQDDGKTPLMMAAESENVQLVALLLEYDAKVNAVTAGNCLTALHLSCRKGDLETTKLLVKHGANISARTGGTYGLTPIEYAQHGSNKEVGLAKERAVFDYMSSEIAERIIKTRASSASLHPQNAFPPIPEHNRVALDQFHQQQTINLARLHSYNTTQHQIYDATDSSSSMIPEQMRVSLDRLAQEQTIDLGLQQQFAIPSQKTHGVYQQQQTYGAGQPYSSTLHHQPYYTQYMDSPPAYAPSFTSSQPKGASNTQGQATPVRYRLA